MRQTRRQFFKKSLAGLITFSAGSIGLNSIAFSTEGSTQSKPWIELSKAAYLHNASQVSKITGGKPVLAVLKNNAYGIGDVQVAGILNASPAIWGIAVVKDNRALAIRAAGVSKPVLLMGDFDRDLFESLVQKEITLSVHSRASYAKIKERAVDVEKPVKVALYIDTGLGRMGIPYREALSIAQEVHRTRGLQITQTFSTLTTPEDFAKEQMSRFEGITADMRKRNIPTGIKHLAPSYSLLKVPSSYQDCVRPGILLHGSFPLADMPQSRQFSLQIPYRLKAPVIRLEKLQAGDTIGFSRFYKIREEEWIATLPVGWADGYDSKAENGAMVLLGNQLYPVVNVNASHANISLGRKTGVRVGDIATLIGPDREEITPEGFGKRVKGHNYLQINYKESLQKKIYETF